MSDKPGRGAMIWGPPAAQLRLVGRAPVEATALVESLVARVRPRVDKAARAEWALAVGPEVSTS